jgi:2-dehydro-3-deoxyglucarate aldolase/4-hydroxy-2-oxoheptanedioate aldolase
MASLRERLHAGERLLGTFVKSPDPSVAELLGDSGLDFLLADYEHSSLSVGEVESIARAVTVPVVVRLSSDSIADAGRLLDSGASGLQVADVHAVATAADACARARYPPAGRRGLAFSHRAARFGREPRAAHLARSAAELLVICQIESSEGIAALPELLVAGLEVDAWFLGPTDLSASLRLGGNTGHAAVQDALTSAADAILGAGARLGIYASDARAARAWADRGATFIAVGSDYTLLAARIDEIVSDWRSAG